MAVHGGFLSVTKDGVSILAEDAQLSDAIDVTKARTAPGVVAVYTGKDVTLNPMPCAWLPPNSQLSPYDAFYLDWDSYYNNEPFYKPFRDLRPQDLCQRAGFDPKKYLQFVTPSIGWFGEKVWSEAATSELEVDSDKTGRLTEGLRWYSFGAWK